MSILFAVFIFVTAFLALHFCLENGWAQRIAIDIPNARSLHVLPTPRVGGVLVLPCVFFGMFLFSNEVFLPLAAVLLWSISWLDDRKHIPAPARLLGHFLVALTVSFCLPFAGWPYVAIIILLVVWGINLYNFMDGADGLAGGVAVLGFSAYAIAAWLNGNETIFLPSAFLVAAALAFLMFNFPPARVFLGDAGSTVFGFFAATLGIKGVIDGTWSCFFPILVFAPFVFDATLTLTRRAIKLERIWEAHREHYYQRLVLLGWPHRKLALSLYSLMLLGIVIAFCIETMASNTHVLWMIAVSIIYLCIMISVDRRWRKRHDMAA